MNLNEQIRRMQTLSGVNEAKGEPPIDPSQVKAYNHKPIGNGKPVVPNKVFFDAIDQIDAGNYDVIDWLEQNYGMDSAQQGLLDRRKANRPKEVPYKSPMDGMTPEEVRARYKELKKKKAKGELTPDEQTFFDKKRKDDQEITQWYWDQLVDWCKAARIKLERQDWNQFKLTRYIHKGNNAYTGKNIWDVKVMKIVPTIERWETNNGKSGTFEYGDFIPVIEKFFDIYI